MAPTLPEHFVPGNHLLATALVLLLGGSAARGATITAVVLTGQPAPGAGVGVTFIGFPGASSSDQFLNRAPVISPEGHAVFPADIGGPGVTSANNIGLWSGAPGALSLAARTGTSAPGTAAGVTFSGFSEHTIGRAGVIAFRGTLTGTGVDFGNNEGYWGGLPGDIALAARRGDAAPGAPTNATHNFLTRLSMGDGGVIAFHSQLFNPQTFAANDALFGGAPSNATMRLLAGNPGVGFQVEGETVGSFFLGGASPLGFLALSATLFAPFSTNLVIIGGQTNSLQIAARQARTADGVPGYAFEGFNQGPVLPAVNDAGQILFVAGVSKPSSASLTGLWLWTPGGTNQPVMITDDPAPGFANGVTFTGSVLSYAVNGRGEVVFVGTVTGPGIGTTNDGGIWAGKPGALRLIAREGMTAPGTGLTFRDINHTVANRFPIRPVINKAGQVAFLALLSAGSPPRDRSLWIAQPDGELVLIARGDAVLATNGVAVGGVSGIEFTTLATGGQDGRPTPFNDAGQLVFSAEFLTPNFESGQGIFLARVAPPTTFSINPDFKLTNGVFRLSVPGESGATYTLERNPNLNTANWSNVTSRAGDGQELTFEDPSPNGSAGFYRVRVQRP